MAENANGEEKTEEATDKKRKDARKKGQVLKSQDVAVVCSLFLTFFVFKLTAKLSYTTLTDCMEHYLSIAGKGIGDIEELGKVNFIKSLITDTTKTFFICCGVLLVATFAVAIISTGLQTRFLISGENLKFKLDKLNPLNGIKKMFSLKSLFELAKSLAKMIVLIIVVYSEIKDRMPDFARLMSIEPMAAVVYIADAVFSIVMSIGVVFVVIAAVDFLFQRREFENDLKMTKQEIKDEYKQMEGDPKVKGKRRAIQQQMANKRMMQEVPSADVIIRNPTHFAVAIKYDPEHNSAPIVVAKGQDMVALRIVDVAAENDVPSVENKPLARSLYDKVKIGQEIPPDFYKAVSEVLVFVYKLKNKAVPISDKQGRMVNTPKPNTPYNY